MKKLLLLAATFFCVAGAYAQGTINFANTPGLEITNAQTSAKIPTTGFTVGLYYGVAGTASESSLSLIATTGIAPVPGRFTGGTVTTPNTTAPGGQAVLQVRAWSSSYATWDLAVQSGVATIGKSVLFTVTTGNPGGSPATTPTALTGLNAFTVTAPVPEPSSIALGLLGLGALALIRRRK